MARRRIAATFRLVEPIHPGDAARQRHVDALLMKLPPRVFPPQLRGLRSPVSAVLMWLAFSPCSALNNPPSRTEDNHYVHVLSPRPADIKLFGILVLPFWSNLSRTALRELSQLLQSLRTEAGRMSPRPVSDGSELPGEPERAVGGKALPADRRSAVDTNVDSLKQRLVRSTSQARASHHASLRRPG